MGKISTETLLFKPIKLREISAANRVVISPMCQYSAEDGLPNQWHYQHISALAAGGAGIVIMEASAVQRQGRITHGDLGIWSDMHSDALVLTDDYNPIDFLDVQAKEQIRMNIIKNF